MRGKQPRLHLRAGVLLIAIVFIAFQISVANGNQNPWQQSSVGKIRMPGRNSHSSPKQRYKFWVIRQRADKKHNPLQRLKNKCQHAFQKLWLHRRKLFHLFVFFYYSHDAVESIMEDSWEAERNPEKFFGKKGILHSNERAVVRRRVVSSKTIRKLAGMGYTPRLVWLFGLMLRGIIHCTALPKIFEVSHEHFSFDVLWMEWKSGTIHIHVSDLVYMYCMGDCALSS